jgi:hypothetical protein
MSAMLSQLVPEDISAENQEVDEPHDTEAENEGVALEIAELQQP